jgi:membrane-associated protease RseP (regulator of RpoE activity)
MRIMSMNFLRGSSEWALMVALVFGAGAIVQAQEDEPKPDGPVVQIGKADADNAVPNLPPPNEGFDLENPGDVEQSELPKFWIGLVGGPIPADHVLRAHVNIPDDQGLLVVSVVPDSPAAKAGLKVHDILLSANDTELHAMEDLVELVRAEGEKKGQIALEVLHHGDRETVYLTPEVRPADAPHPRLGGGGFGSRFGGEGLGVLGEDGLPKELLQQFEGRMPFEFRNFGPGVIVGGGGRGIASVPNGVTVNIVKDGDKPARITIKRGDETWEVVGDDPKSLNQLPEDLRPFVKQMLQGASPLELNFRRPGQPPMPELGDGRIGERLERMEKRMQELMERFGQEDQPANEPPQNSDQTK